MATPRQYPEDDSRGKVYVGNIPGEMTENELLDEFERYGRVERCWIAKAPPGFAFVWFANPEDAEAAVSGLDDATVMGRVIKVEIARPSRGAPPPRDYEARRSAPKGPGGFRVKITNLPAGVDWREIKDTFRKSGEVAYANVNGDEGIAEFSSERDREQAIRDFDDTTLSGRRILVEKIEGSSADHFARRASRNRRTYDYDEYPPRRRSEEYPERSRSPYRRPPPSNRPGYDRPRYYDDRGYDRPTSSYDRRYPAEDRYPDDRYDDRAGYDRPGYDRPGYDRGYDRGGGGGGGYDRGYDRGYERGSNGPQAYDTRAPRDYDRNGDRGYDRRRD